MMKKYRIWVLVFGFCGALFSFNSVFAFGDFQKTICHVKDLISASDGCRNGQVLLFAPSVFGNEQTPIYVASFFCDFEFPVVHNTGGVSCIYTDKRKAAFEQMFKNKN